MARGPVKYFQEVVKEGRRVRWPKRDALFPMIITVTIIALFFGLFLALEDYVGGSLVAQLQDLFSGLFTSTSTSESSSSAAEEASSESASESIEAASAFFYLIRLRLGI